MSFLNSHCILKRSHPREQRAVTTKVVKMTGQGREATNLPYLNYDHDHDDYDDDDYDDGRLCVCNEFATRLKVTFGTIAIPVSRVQFCQTHHLL